MKALMLAATFALVPVAASARMVNEYDRFQQEQAIRYFSDAPARDGIPRFTLLGKVKGGAFSGTVGFFVESLTSIWSRKSAWKYLSCHSVSWLVDGKPLNLGASVHDGDVKAGEVTEVILQDATLDQMSQMAAAQRIEYRICTDEYVVSADEMSGLRQFVAAVKQAQAAP